MDKPSLGYLTLRVMFSAMHELGNTNLSEAENRKIFGKCYKTHGHHYYLEATVRGPIDKLSGLCCKRDEVEDILHDSVVKKLNGTHLNKIFKNTAGEALVKELYKILEPQIPGLIMIRLQETAKNFFTYGQDSISDFQFLMY